MFIAAFRGKRGANFPFGADIIFVQITSDFCRIASESTCMYELTDVLDYN